MRASILLAGVFLQLPAAEARPLLKQAMHQIRTTPRRLKAGLQFHRFMWKNRKIKIDPAGRQTLGQAYRLEKRSNPTGMIRLGKGALWTLAGLGYGGYVYFGKTLLSLGLSSPAAPMIFTGVLSAGTITAIGGAGYVLLSRDLHRAQVKNRLRVLEQAKGQTRTAIPESALTFYSQELVD